MQMTHIIFITINSAILDIEYNYVKMNEQQSLTAVEIISKEIPACFVFSVVWRFLIYL